MRKIVRDRVKKIPVSIKKQDEEKMFELKTRLENRLLELDGYTEYCQEQDELLYAQWEESPELLDNYNNIG